MMKRDVSIVGISHEPGEGHDDKKGSLKTCDTVRSTKGDDRD